MSEVRREKIRRCWNDDCGILFISISLVMSVKRFDTGMPDGREKEKSRFALK
jgi:hypothetical protein